MRAALSVEIRKLKRSLALGLVLTAPALIAAFCFFSALNSEAPRPWSVWMGGALGLWAVFMLPLSVTALTALMAQMEHMPRSWDHVRALHVPRWHIHGAKLLCALGLVAVMSVLLLGMSWSAVKAAAWLRPGIAPTEALDPLGHAATLARMFLSAWLMIVIQLWVAIRFTSFVPALALGIGGAFMATVANAAWQGVFVPWQMPANMLAKDPWRGDVALALGLGVGVACALAMLLHLSRREF